MKSHVRLSSMLSRTEIKKNEHLISGFSPRLFSFQFLVRMSFHQCKKSLGAKKLGNLHKGKTFSHASCICFRIFLEFFGLIDMHNHQFALWVKMQKIVQKNQSG